MGGYGMSLRLLEIGGNTHTSHGWDQPFFFEQGFGGENDLSGVDSIFKDVVGGGSN